MTNLMKSILVVFIGMTISICYAQDSTNEDIVDSSTEVESPAESILDDVLDTSEQDAESTDEESAESEDAEQPDVEISEESDVEEAEKESTYTAPAPVVKAPTVQLEEAPAFEEIQFDTATPTAEQDDLPPVPPVETLTEKPIEEPVQKLDQPKAEDVSVIPPEPVEYGDGIDTIDIDSSGNWLQKRVIWEDAQDKYEEIKELMNSVIDARMEFFTQRSSLDKTVNLFFSDSGFAQGELAEIIDDMVQTIEEERREQGSLDERERSLQVTLVDKKNEIEQLKLDLSSISELDEALDTALLELLKQINLCNDYEQQAWDRFKAIGQELDDKKAGEHYLYMDALLKNIDAIYQYINGPFNQYFTSSIQKMQQQIDAIKTALDGLQEQGVELQKKVDEAEELPLYAEPQEDQPVKQGWLESIKGTFNDAKAKVSSWISNIWTWSTSWFKKSEPEATSSN